jgi:hypothetical protein
MDAVLARLAAFEFVDDECREETRSMFASFQKAHQVVWRKLMERVLGVSVAGCSFANERPRKIIERGGQNVGSIDCAAKVDYKSLAKVRARDYQNGKLT